MIFKPRAWDCARLIEKDVNGIDQLMLDRESRLRWQSLALRLRQLADHIDRVVKGD